MNIGIEVRLATEADVEAILSLAREIPTAPQWTGPIYQAMLAPTGEELRRGLFVATRNGRLIGFAAGRVLRDEGELESIAVREQERRHGVGNALLEAVMGWCWVWGASRVELEVRSGSRAARRLYGTFGFMEVGRRAAYYSDPVEDAILMRWALE